METNDLELLASLVGPCPNCQNGILQAVHDGERTNFLCRACGNCFHPELDWVSRVSYETCPGCPERATCTHTSAGGYRAASRRGARSSPSP